MKHLGDITKISGRDAPMVNVVIGGSPCQDLSISGKRQGLSGERSGLFMEMIRIIREMREKDANAGRIGAAIRPRYMVWENVPGAFSVNGGRDFAAVIEETIRTADQNIPNVLPPTEGWSNSGCFLGRGWSIAWRVLDAQFWGVPQRRRRIALVADFGGSSAPEILFEREGMSGDSQPSKAQRERTAGIAADCTGTANTVCIEGNGCRESHRIGYAEEQSLTLRTANDSSVCYGICSDKSNSMLSGNPNSGIYEADTSRTLDCNCGNPACNQGGIAIVEQETASRGADSEWLVHNAKGNGTGRVVATLTGDHDRRVTDCTNIVYNRWKLHDYRIAELASTLAAHLAKEPTDVVCAAVDARNCSENPDINGTLQAKESSGSSVNLNNVVRKNLIVRRLTPLECERLQGFPDGWTDIGEWTDTKGKKRQTSDAMRYKALGNSIALMPWVYVCARLSMYCDDVRMASLFDGIGGFPLIWAFLHGKEACVWASEIEEFPIAVTKRRFPE